MATTVPVSSPPVHPSAPASTTPMMQNTNTPLHQNVYMMPAPQGNTSSRILRPVPGVLCLSIPLIFLAGILVALGVAAIVLKAKASYVANPIWTGLLFLATGILGIFVHRKRTVQCVNISFLVMSIISSACAFQLMQCAWIFAGLRENPWDCVPLFWSYSCGPFWARVLVGVVIGFCALAALVLCIVSFSVTMYGTFTCCYDCCRCCRIGSGSQTMVQYSNHTGVAMTPITMASGVQVMGSTPLPQQNMSVMQQEQTIGSNPMFIVATPPQSYLQSSPPVYASSPEAFIVASNQQATPVAGSNPAPQSAVVHPQLSAGDQVNNQSVAVASDSTPRDRPSGGQVANNPENWQQF